MAVVATAFVEPEAVSFVREVPFGGTQAATRGDLHRRHGSVRQPSGDATSHHTALAGSCFFWWKTLNLLLIVDGVVGTRQDQDLQIVAVRRARALVEQVAVFRMPSEASGADQVDLSLL